MKKTCYICPRDRFVDGHHYDCREGELSPEKVPLCRRCHRTYHDLGVEWFEDEFLDKAIEIENRRREIHGLSPIRREDVCRSAYFNKVHGIKGERSPSPSRKGDIPFRMPSGPLCGWAWLMAHQEDHTQEEMETLSIDITCSDRRLLRVVAGGYKRGAVKKVMREAAFIAASPMQRHKEKVKW